MLNQSTLLTSIGHWLQRGSRIAGYLMLIVVAIASAVSARADEETGADVYRSLGASGGAEGHYVVKTSLPRLIHINIICMNHQALAASLRAEDDTVNFSLVHTAVDGDVISFVTFHISPDDAKTMSSSNTDVRLRLDIPSLKQGILKGSFRALNRVDPVSINGTRSGNVFPSLFAGGNNRAGKPLEGSFAFTSPKFKGVVAIEVIGGLQRVNLNIEEMGAARVLYNGLPAGEAAGVVYATSGVDDGTSGNIGLLHVRGRLLNPNELELYYLDTKKGLVGPLRATRRNVR